MRLDKFLSNLKYGTRTEVKKAIKEGKVTINGKSAKEGKEWINPVKDTVYYEGEKVFFEEKIVLMLNKPKGYVSATKDNLHKTVVELIGEPYSRFDLKIAGRLDIDTEGLIILTNDGNLLHNLINPKKDVFKKYYVEVDRHFDVDLLLEPMVIKDGNNQEYSPLKPKVSRITDKSFCLEIQEGKFHQVKRMCQYCGATVTYLKRISIGDIVLDENLSLGEYKKI